MKDVTDLFGADLPVEGGEAGQFVWRDGPLLKALRAGHWIVLDEVLSWRYNGSIRIRVLSTNGLSSELYYSGFFIWPGLFDRWMAPFIE